MSTLKSRLLEGIQGLRHGFGNRQEPVPSEFLPKWDQLKPQWKQVHGIAIAEVKGPSDRCGEVDALFTRMPGQPIAVVTADCVPILLARRDGLAVAAVHAGWRGTRARILAELWRELSEKGERPADWVAAIGPSIGPCCYEVSEELARDFAAEFAAVGEGIAVPRTRHLDLPAINAAELRRLGVGEVDLLRACTLCSGGKEDPLYCSYRRDGTGTRQWSMIFSGTAAAL